LSDQNVPPTGDPALLLGGVVPYEQPIDRTVPPAEGPVAEKREDARKTIAYVLLGVFVVELIFFGVTLFQPDPIWQRAQHYMEVVLAGTFGLLSSVVGFYFGSQR
jgi:hypothetical protein